MRQDILIIVHSFITHKAFTELTYVPGSMLGPRVDGIQSLPLRAENLVDVRPRNMRVEHMCKRKSISYSMDLVSIVFSNIKSQPVCVDLVNPTDP